MITLMVNVTLIVLGSLTLYQLMALAHQKRQKALQLALARKRQRLQ